MSTDEFSLLASGVWLIPLAVLALVGGLYLAVRYWQNRIQRNLKILRGNVRRIQGKRNEALYLLQEYASEESEPFKSRVEMLQAQLQDDTRLLGGLERGLVRAQERAHALLATRWEATIGSPYEWYALHRLTGQLMEDCQALDAAIEVVEEQLQELNQLGWELASRCRELRQLQVQANKTLDQLHTHNVQGEAMEKALRREERSRKALSQIPPYFFEGNEEDVLDQCDRETITRVYEIVTAQEPLLKDLVEKVTGWEQRYHQTAKNVNLLSQAVRDVELALEQAPPTVNTSEVRQEFNPLKVISRTMNDTLSRLEIESMPEVIAEAERVYKAVREMEASLKQARRQSGELERILAELSEGLRQLSSQFAALGTHTRRPIAWDQSRSRLTNLSRQTSAMGPSKKPRPPQQIAEDLAIAVRLVGEYKELAGYCQQVSQAHGEILALLESPELRQAVDWSRNAYTLAGKVQEYDPENWPKQDATHTLAADLQQWEEQYQALVPENQAEPVPEGQVQETLAGLRSLVELTGRLQERAGKIRTRLEEIQRVEGSATSQLEALQLALSQIGHLLRSNPVLGEVAASELERLQSNLQQLAQDLDQPLRGPVERKERLVSTFAAKVEQTANAWLDRFTKELDAQKKDLAARLTGLEAIGNLDEPAIAEAHRLLADGQAFEGAAYGRKSRLSLSDLILELKRRCDYWQGSAANFRALEDLGDPLLETHAAASQNRQHAHEQLEDLVSWLRGAGGWPPTSLNFDQELSELAALDEQWKALKDQQMRAISLVQRLSDLSARYYHLAERSRQKAERIASEQDHVEEIEAEVMEMVGLWQQQRQAYHANPTVSDEIRKLLDQVDSQLKAIQKLSKDGRKSYQQVAQDMEAVRNRLRRAQVMVDDQHVIDHNGRMIAYR